MIIYYSVVLGVNRGVVCGYFKDVYLEVNIPNVESI